MATFVFAAALKAAALVPIRERTAAVPATKLVDSMMKKTRVVAEITTEEG